MQRMPDDVAGTDQLAVVEALHSWLHSWLRI